MWTLFLTAFLISAYTFSDDKYYHYEYFPGVDTSKEECGDNQNHEVFADLDSYRVELSHAEERKAEIKGEEDVKDLMLQSVCLNDGKIFGYINEKYVSDHCDDGTKLSQEDDELRILSSDEHAYEDARRVERPVPLQKKKSFYQRLKIW